MDRCALSLTVPHLKGPLVSVSALPKHVVVVGGGIAGLAAAEFLKRDGGDAVRVTVLEASAVIGGKVRVSEVAGVPVDEGAESMLARRPEGVDLIKAIGLSNELVYPATTTARIWTRGALRSLPAGHVMGVPGEMRALTATGLLSSTGLARVVLDRVLPRTPFPADVAIGRYVTARLGREVVDRLVEPLLGGIYAGHADALSLDATAPSLAPVVRQERSLLAAVRRVRADGLVTSGPVFAGVQGGLGRLPRALAAASGAQVRTNTSVHELRRRPAGWQVIAGPPRAPEVIEADAVIVAAPANQAAQLLVAELPAAAAELAAIEYASVAVITLGYSAAAFPKPFLSGDSSGFLVPPVEGRLIKAVTYSSVKWKWVRQAQPDTVIVRLSIGRHGDERDLEHSDDELIARCARELKEAIRIAANPLAARVTRWGSAMPQYAVGHRERVARIRTAVAQAPGLAVCGAAYDGVGIPACIATAHQAATHIARGPLWPGFVTYT